MKTPTVMTLSEAFDACEKLNGRGSTALLADYNKRGLDSATIEANPMSSQSQIVIRVNGKIAGLSRKIGA